MYCPEIQSEIKNAQIVKINNAGTDYQFSEYAFGEHGTLVNVALINEIVSGLTKLITETAPNFDLLVAPVPGGHAWGLALGYSLQKDILILRTHDVAVGNRNTVIINGYSRKHLCYTPIAKNLQIIIVDDVISSGATLADMVHHFQGQVVGAYAIYTKSFSKLQLSEKYQIPFYALVDESEME